MVSWSVLYEIVHWLDSSWLLLYWFMLLKVTGKVLFGCNILYSSIIHRIHSYYYCLLFLVLLTGYMITVDWYIVLLLSLYSLSILSNIDIDCFNWNDNNINGHLTLGLRKLMEETTSVFSVDLGTGCAADWRFHYRVPEGWLASHLYYFTVLLFIQWAYCYCYWVPSGTVWFNTRKLRPWSRVCTGHT